MPLGRLTINGYDAYEKWGLSLSDGARAELMTPAPNKSRAYNVSRLRHGKEPVGSPERKESREVSLRMHITGPRESWVLAKYRQFCQVLDEGTLDIVSYDVPDTVFHFKYLSCSDFSVLKTIMKFTLKLEEPNPNNRV